jgi:hypothetical protein
MSPSGSSLPPLAACWRGFFCVWRGRGAVEMLPLLSAEALKRMEATQAKPGEGKVGISPAGSNWSQPKERAPRSVEMLPLLSAEARKRQSELVHVNRKENLLVTNLPQVQERAPRSVDIAAAGFQRGGGHAKLTEEAGQIVRRSHYKRG